MPILALTRWTCSPSTNTLSWITARVEEWTYKGYTLDKFVTLTISDYTATKLFTSPFVRRIKRFMYLTDMYASRLTSTVLMENRSSLCNLRSAWYWGLHDQPAADGAILMEMALAMNIRTSVMESANWAWEIDSKGDVWMAPENGPIRRYRVQVG